MPETATITQTQEYDFSATTADGRHVDQALTASGVEEATLQAWDVIQQHQRNGVQIETARIEWSNDEGPQVSYIYDRTQGFEISKPEGLDLQNNPATFQMRTMEDAIRQQTPTQAVTQEHPHEHHQQLTFKPPARRATTSRKLHRLRLLTLCFFRHSCAHLERQTALFCAQLVHDPRKNLARSVHKVCTIRAQTVQKTCMIRARN